MPRDYDRMFAQAAAHNRLLSGAMADACMEKLRQMEEAGEEGTLARVAV